MTAVTRAAVGRLSMVSTGMEDGMPRAFFGCVIAVAVCFGLVPRPSHAQDQAPAPAASPRDGGAETADPAVEVKKVFAAQCGWCHADYGLKDGKAPRLAGTRMTEKQVSDRIRNGKTDAMPAFRRSLTEDQIQAFTQYIKGLKVPE